MTRIRETGTYLDRILANTIDIVTASKRAESALEMAIRALKAPVPAELTIPIDRLGVIAEFKRASPSKGRFTAEIEPADVASAYLEGGAIAISCLTDELFFEGSLDDLDTVVATVAGHIPVLRKDFTIDPYQIDEARTHGASMVLLIVAALDDVQLIEFRQQAESLGMQALVEVHDDAEAERAINSGATLIGINNRDLRSFQTDLVTTERIAPQLPIGTTIVGESGIHSITDAERMAAAGCQLLLVGESVIMQGDRAAAVRELSSVRRV